MGFFDFLTEEIAIDLGTANTLIIHNDKVVVDSPSIVAMDRVSNKIIAVGQEANQMQGKTHENIKTIRPLKDGVIADFNASEQMISLFIKNIPSLKKRFFTPSLRMVICIPSGITEVEMRAVRESAERAGAKQVFLIEEPMAAAIGAGLPVNDPTGSMVIDIGGGTTEVGITSLGGIVYAESERVGGDKIDQAIIDYMRRNYGMMISEPTAEKIKKQIGSAFPLNEILEMEVTGRSMSEGLPRKIIISSNEILEALAEPLNSIISAVKSALEQTPPELGADIAENGMVLTGGGALLKNLDRLLFEETGIPVLVAEEPLMCVVNGCGMALDSLDEFKTAFTND